jgi:hypothetical protein
MTVATYYYGLYFQLSGRDTAGWGGDVETDWRVGTYTHPRTVATTAAAKKKQ